MATNTMITARGKKVDDENLFLVPAAPETWGNKNHIYKESVVFAMAEVREMPMGYGKEECIIENFLCRLPASRRLMCGRSMWGPLQLDEILRLC